MSGAAKRMRAAGRLGCLAIPVMPMILAAAAFAGAAMAQQGDAGGDAAPPRALASNGAIVPMPELSELDCRGMAEVMGLIDQSRYRGPAPVPEGHPDREIFEYEHRLAAAYYHGCIVSGSRLDDPGPAFGQGFEQP